jgi:hypothetical protein
MNVCDKVHGAHFDVCLGSLADVATPGRYVRFTPRKQTFVSAGNVSGADASIAGARSIIGLMRTGLDSLACDLSCFYLAVGAAFGSLARPR